MSDSFCKTYERAWWSVAKGEGVDNLSVAMETSFRLQDVEAFEEVDGESLPQEESLRESLEGLPVWYITNFLQMLN